MFTVAILLMGQAVNVRTTTQTQIGMMMANLRQQTGSLSKYQNQLGSGLAVAKPSDGASLFSKIFQDKSTAARFDSYMNSMTDASSTLNQSVSGLQDGNQILVRAKQLALDGANQSTDQTTAETMANEVDGLLNDMLGIANSTFEGQNLFAGTSTSGGQAFKVATADPQGRPTSITYAGADDSGKTLVGSNQTVVTQPSGREVFQKTGADVFQALMGLRDDLRSTTMTSSQKSTALSARVGNIDAAREAISTTMGNNSSTLANIESLQTRTSDLKLTATSRFSDMQGTDYAEATIHLREQENVFQASLAVSSRLIQPSLMEFIN